jgi:hypothetical protein
VRIWLRVRVKYVAVTAQLKEGPRYADLRRYNLGDLSSLVRNG